MDLYWFMPALAKSKVGSECGTTDEEGTVDRISANIRAFKPRLYTECMLLLLEVVDERFPHPHGRPLLCRPHLGQCSAKPPTACKVVV